MARKFSPQRRNAFLAALRATGNQTLAAERARVSLSWVRLHRSNDAAFNAAVVKAIASFDKARDKREGNRPPPRWAWHDGEELVVTGRAGGPRKIVRARIGQWTPRLEARFCAALRSCPHVALACRAAGLSAAAAYRHRTRWPDFARRWDAAIAAGRERLEGDLRAAAIASLDPGLEWSEDYAVGPVSVAEAIMLVGRHRRRAERQ